jgi:GH24 family phage-related lysozyme (muramidase)
VDLIHAPEALMRIWTVVRGHLARSVQIGAPADQVTELRRELAAARAADHLHRLVASDLPPTKAQREELAAILTGAEL